MSGSFKQNTSLSENIVWKHLTPHCVLNWIKGFVSDRQQRVLLEGEASNWERVLSGVSTPRVDSGAIAIYSICQ